MVCSSYLSRMVAAVTLILASLVLLVATATATAATAAKPFGITNFSMQTTAATTIINHGAGATCYPCEIVNEPYAPAFSQAGGHPWALTTIGRFTSEEILSRGGEPQTEPTRDPKDIAVELPPGLFGNPQAVPRCPLSRLVNIANNTGSGPYRCPADTQIGVAKLATYGTKPIVGPLVNLTPEAGQSAEFGIETAPGVNFLLTAHLVRTPTGYSISVTSNGIPIVELVEYELTFWGVPADPSHDPMRGMFCATSSGLDCSGGGESAGVAPVPFLSMPTDCAQGPGTAIMRADSWEEPGHIGINGQYDSNYKQAQTTMPGVVGCDLLRFDPSIGVEPDTLLADEPVGLGVNVVVPQNQNPGSNATPHLRNAVVTLPEGMSVSPGVVDGIQACNLSGPEGINFTGPESEETGLNGELELAPGHCPDASSVGSAEAITPVLPEPVKGHVYLARPGCGGTGQAPCTAVDAADGNLYKLYLELGGTGALANAGVNIKVEGKVEANPATGQLTTTFAENPQTPFSELKIHLNGGPRAPLDTPAACGPARTMADFTPWSEPGVTPAPEALAMPGTPDATPSSFFEVSGCESPPGLRPGFQAGMVTPQAGQLSTFTLNLSREDREQYVRGIQLHTPPGLLGMLSSVPLCQEPAASEGTCPESSKIGTTRVASGAGSHPFEIGGDVYLTGPYRGAPFGLSIVTHAVAGPFNLGLVTVRARIDVDPADSTLTVSTDEAGPYAIPQIVDGVPLRLQRVTVNIDRPAFMFNPTNCTAQTINATISGAQGATARVSSPFAVAGCKSLGFAPQFKVSTSGHTSRANGASLDAKLSFPASAFGRQANVAYAKVSLPTALPSRLTTLQKACPSATFEANPAACPAPSVVGIVRASTPLLPVGLQGPVYFVSHGGEAFPSLVVVLQGDGVRVDLTGSTFISKAGVTSNTFRAVPDVPVTSFELYFPEGPYSALAANGNLCSQTKLVTVKHKHTEHIHGRTIQHTVTTHVREAKDLVMPSEFVAQNGTVFKQSTKIEVNGCAKTRTARTKARRATRARPAARDLPQASKERGSHR